MKLIAEVFPEFAPRVCPFGYDWLGRQFAVDAGRVDAGQPQVLLLEPGTGEALEVPCSFSAFHDEELIDFADAALAVQFFEAWSVATVSARCFDATSALAIAFRCSWVVRTKFGISSSATWMSTGRSVVSCAGKSEGSRRDPQSTRRSGLERMLDDERALGAQGGEARIVGLG